MVATKPAPVTPADLQRLIRLRREGVEGAAQELLAVADSAADELSSLLGLSPERLRSLNADGIAVALENARRRFRERKVEASLSSARALATVVSRGVQRSSGMTSLPVESFAALVLTPGYRYLAFTSKDGPYGLNKTILARLLRECRRAKLESITIDEFWLKVLYRTETSHGRVRFILGRVPEDEAIVVDCSGRFSEPVPDKAQAPTPTVVEVSTIPVEQPIASTPSDPPRRAPRKTKAGGFWAHLSRALEEAV